MPTRAQRVAIESAIREWFRSQPGQPGYPHDPKRNRKDHCLCERCTKWTEDLAEVVMQALVGTGGGR